MKDTLKENIGLIYAMYNPILFTGFHSSRRETCIIHCFKWCSFCFTRQEQNSDTSHHQIGPPKTSVPVYFQHEQFCQTSRMFYRSNTPSYNVTSITTTPHLMQQHLSRHLSLPLTPHASPQQNTPTTHHFHSPQSVNKTSLFQFFHTLSHPLLLLVFPLHSFLPCTVRPHSTHPLASTSALTRLHIHTPQTKAPLSSTPLFPPLPALTPSPSHFNSTQLLTPLPPTSLYILVFHCILLLSSPTLGSTLDT